MDQEFDIQIEGGAEVEAMLRDLPRVVVASAFLKGLQAGGQVIEAELQARAPENLHPPQKHPHPPLGESVVAAVTLDSDFRGGIVEVGFGKEGFRAFFVEYGHRMVGHKPGKAELGYVNPKPFMRVAAAAAFDPAVNAFTEQVAKVLKGQG